MRTPLSQNLHQFDTNNPNYDWMTTRPNFVEPYQERNMQFNSFNGYNNYNKKRNIKNKGYYPSANQRYGYNYGQTQYQPGHFLEKGLIQNLQQQMRENSFQMKNILERIEAMQSHYQMARNSTFNTKSTSEPNTDGPISEPNGNANSANEPSHPTDPRIRIGTLSDKLKISFLNIQGLISTTKKCKVPMLRDLMVKSRSNLLIVTESHLNNNILDAEIRMEGYDLIRGDRKERSHGGVAIYTSSNIISETFNYLLFRTLSVS